MQKLTEFLMQLFSMGGYGQYVWPAFLAAAFIIFAMVAASLRSLRRAQKGLARLQPDAPPHET